MKPVTEKSTEYLSTLERGLTVLRSFSRDRKTMNLTQVAEVTDLSPAVVRRCLLTLEHLGYVTRVDSRFSLAPGVLSLASLFSQTYGLDETIRPVLQRLRETTGESASFTVLQGSDVLYLCHVSAERSIRLQANAGTRYPALVTSTGRCILSGWRDPELREFLVENPVPTFTDKTETSQDVLFEKIRAVEKEGYATISDELDYGITSLAVPVIMLGRGVVGAVNSSAQTQRVDLTTFAEERKSLVAQAASDIAYILNSAPDLLDALS